MYYIYMCVCVGVCVNLTGSKLHIKIFYFPHSKVTLLHVVVFCSVMLRNKLIKLTFSDRDYNIEFDQLISQATCQPQNTGSDAHALIFA